MDLSILMSFIPWQLLPLLMLSISFLASGNLLNVDTRMLLCPFGMALIAFESFLAYLDAKFSQAYLAYFHELWFLCGKVVRTII